MKNKEIPKTSLSRHQATGYYARLRDGISNSKLSRSKLRIIDSVWNKKAQEEMVGFVMVMVVVAVIFLVFLGIFFRQGTPEKTTHSPEIVQFLDSIGEITSSCTTNQGYFYKNFNELIIICSEGLLCEGIDACVILERDLTNIIESSWNFNPEGVEKGYRLKLGTTHSDGTFNSLLSKEILSIGNCSLERRFADKPIGNDIFLELEICL
jgi:hypothetical protein